MSLSRASYIGVRAINAVAALFFLNFTISRLWWFGFNLSTDLPYFVVLTCIFMFNTFRPVKILPALRWAAIVVNGCLAAIGAAAAVFGIVDPVGLFFATMILPPSLGALIVCLHEAQRTTRPA